MNGEWKSDDGLYTVITKTRGNGFDAWNKNDAANKIYYNTISANEYRYTSPSGTKMVLKMMNINRLENFQNGQHFGYFSRSASAPNETNQAAKNTSPIEEGEWIDYDSGLRITTKAATNGLLWKVNSDNGDFQFFSKIAPNTYRWSVLDTVYFILKFINNNRFSLSYSGNDTISYLNRLSSTSNENKLITSESAFEADIKKLADYFCKAQVVEEKLKKNENDNEALNEYRKIMEEATNFTTNLEAKYTKEMVESEAERKIT